MSFSRYIDRKKSDDKAVKYQSLPQNRGNSVEHKIGTFFLDFTH